MYEILKMVHSWWAYVVVIVLIVAVINSLLGFFSKKEYKIKDYRIGLFGLIVSHIQLIIGIVLYFVSPLFTAWSSIGGGVMKEPQLRKMLVEHPFGVILGITLITIGWSLHKKQKDLTKNSQKAFSKIAIFYTIGLILMLGVIPWSSWLNL